MITSMTGFGRGESQSTDRRFLVEIKSLNHRYLDINIKMPKMFTYLEENIRQTIKDYVKRGRVEVFISYENIGDTEVKVIADVPLAEQYLNALTKLKELPVKDDVTVSLIAKYPDVIRVEKKELDEDATWNALVEALKNSLSKLSEMRKIEGAQLKEDLLMRLGILADYIKEIEGRSPQIVVEYRQRLNERIKELLEEGYHIEESRILMEVALFADKSSIVEEIVRFGSHIKQFTKTMEENDSIGRKLDFLIQEMNREVNTIGSKANDLTITNIVVNLKSELEKMREQVQNIE
ncbi:YicC/YloC family endoribonuclease [Alkaliphilus transvaalensis]|uniref:YicC/YloC family endoribonuclease n=1 Tax=Alkaliphilus transvaalensis TaxID=114628 RepID=UPI00047D68A9|nr:YicC/YloC family endoribonuclease [Alkaliphilus transvaalensis]